VKNGVLPDNARVHLALPMTEKNRSGPRRTRTPPLRPSGTTISASSSAAEHGPHDGSTASEYVLERSSMTGWHLIANSEVL